MFALVSIGNQQGQLKMFDQNDQEKIASRFWLKVKKGRSGDCWQWTGAVTRSGYGLLAVRKGENRAAHRVSFALLHGPSALTAGLHIAHECHNRLCVNPSHLVQITAGENVGQSRSAGRTARGTRYKNAKLNENAVRDIRRTAEDLDGECAMMVKYRVSQITVQAVFQRKLWKHVVD